jgi:NTP pyrophosphatase (non-canonical NTP hydrolase)
MIREPDEYDAFIDVLADAMRYKLRLNKHKGWIGDIPLSDLLLKLRAEVAELEDAIKKGNRIDMILESADVSNFALAAVMVAINARKEAGKNDIERVAGAFIRPSLGGAENDKNSVGG